MMEKDVFGKVQGLVAARVPVHMSGIGGVGMAGLALLLQSRGVPVSGCDLQPGPLVEALRAKGISVDVGHVALQEGAAAGWVIRSAAVQTSRPDIQSALNRNVPVFRRGEVLPVLVALASQSIIIAGTHGKTTTATLAAHLLSSLDPSWCIGGVSEAFPLPGGGGSGPLVVEADESDGTLALYAPSIAVVTNVDFDHMEHFASVEAFEACFSTFLGQARDGVIYCADDARASMLARASGRRVLGYGFGASAAIRGFLGKDGVLRIAYPDGVEIRLRLPGRLPGVHNALNMLGALSICYEMGLPASVWGDLVGALRLPARRFELLAEHGGIQVISDYAHHPAEITVLVQMVRSLHNGRVLVVFQPHRYTRTAALRGMFPLAFTGIDFLVLTPVYAASEDPVPGGTTEDLLREFETCCVPYDTVFACTLEDAAQNILERLAPGDMVLIIGAGDVEKAGRIVGDAIRGLYGNG
ncbi:MAG: UDP-N-acetylmuramate--L-alanine ligase [Kiritimatiellia bacterium]